MGTENDGPFPSKLFDQVPNINNLFGIQSVCRFIKNDNLGISYDRTGDADSLTVAFGKIFDHSVEGVFNFDDTADFHEMLFAVQGTFFEVVNKIQVFFYRHFQI